MMMITNNLLNFTDETAESQRYSIACLGRYGLKSLIHLESSPLILCISSALLLENLTRTSKPIAVLLNQSSEQTLLPS